MAEPTGPAVEIVCRCGAIFIRHGRAKHCSQACRVAADRASARRSAYVDRLLESKRQETASRTLIRFWTCIMCDKLFVRPAAVRSANVCSVLCRGRRDRSRYAERRKVHREGWVARGGAAAASRRRRQTESGKAESRQRTKWRRARSRGAMVVDKFDPIDVYERDGWRCHLCRRAIPRKAVYPNPKSASLDHIIPLSVGGEHSLANVAAAHLACNLAKSNRAENDQLRLIG